MKALNQSNLMFKNDFNYLRYLAVLAVLAIFLPIHPSMQGIIITLGIPSIILAGSLALLPIFYCFYPKFNKLVLFVFGNFLFFIAWLLLKSVTSTALGDLNNIKTTLSLFFLLLSITCSYVASKDSRAAINVFAFMGIGALLHFIYLLAGEGFSFQALAFHSLSTNDGRQNYQSTAFYLGFVALFFSSNIFARDKGKLNKLLSFIGVIVTVVAMSLVGARAAILAVVIVFCMLVVMTKTPAVFKATLYFVFILLLMLIVINIEFLFDTLTIFQRFESLGDGSDSSKRMFLFQSAINLWLESPQTFLFGNGIGTFTRYIGESGLGWYPHNFILECLAEAGIVSIIPILLVAFVFTRKIIKFEYKTTYVYLYTISLSLYAVITYQFVGGILTMWISSFFICFTIFSFDKINEQ